MAKKRDWRASGMTARWKASLPKRGERTRKGPSWRRILSPVSFLFVLYFGFLGTPQVVQASRTELLTGPLEELRAHYGMEDLEVDWKMSSGLAAAIEALGPLSWEWTMDLPANCPDRVVAKIRAATGTEKEVNATTRPLNGSSDDLSPRSSANSAIRPSKRSPEYLISGRTEVHRIAYRATRTLRKGSLVLEADLELSEGWVSPSAWVVEEADDVVGSYVRATIARGAFVGQSDLRERPLIQMGHEVRVEFHGTGLLVTSRATSRRDAWLGDSIQVRVAGAGKDCRALVTGPNLVVVERRLP